MDTPRPIWLVDNAASGSNDEDALTLLEESCGSAGFHVAHRTHFPRYDLPTTAMLDAAGIELVAVFAGDGTINATITHLAGWTGAVLVLPGGTMNLLYHRLHGQRDMHEVVCIAARGQARRERPMMVRTGEWGALAGLMAGPGTSWNDVRESMRASSLVEMAGKTVAAIGETVSGARIVCREPQLGRREGYPLVLLHPLDEGIEVIGYQAGTAGEYLEQSVALLKRDFREGPHDNLGLQGEVALASTDGQPFGMLVDGEPVQLDAAELSFALVPCEVDLLVSKTGAGPLLGEVVDG